MPVFVTDNSFGSWDFNRLAFERAAHWLIRNMTLFLKGYKGVVPPFTDNEPQLSVLLTTDSDIKAINEQWFGRPWPTNVISFAQQAVNGFVPDFSPVLGDIVISVETAAKEASYSGITLSQRMEELLIHGLAHILGEDHEDEISAQRMKLVEVQLKKLLHGGQKMPELCINVDHIATIRQARGGDEPDPVTAASLVELAGADGIVVHLREDRRHIQDRDVRLLRRTVKTRLNLEMAATDEIISIACEIRPDVVTLVPEKRKELTTEGGLDVLAHKKLVKEAVSRLHESGIPVSLFINPEEKQIEASKEVQADCVEIHTGRYADASSSDVQDEEFERIFDAARVASELGLRVHAGHGLDYRNVTRVAAISYIDELSIGHAVIARAALVGLERAVREMLSLVKRGVPL